MNFVLDTNILIHLIRQTPHLLDTTDTDFDHLNDVFFNIEKIII
ncbi:MAG: hypothetical protein RL329_1138 [Bacteroidota bacterium]|jgi:predicted nucleic acid-binding protein